MAEHQTRIQTVEPNYVLGESETQSELAEIVVRGVQRRERRAQRQAEETQTEASQARLEQAEAAETAAVKATEVSYQEAVNELTGLPNTEKIQRLIADERVPASEKARLQSFSQIIAIADQVPQDAPLVRQRINQLDMSQGVPDPVRFARAFIFDSPNSQLPSGVTQATQEAIAASLGIERRPLEVTTGSEMTEVFEQGVGTRMVRDPETGELREEPIFLQPGEFEEIRAGQAIGLTDQGDRAMRFDEEVGSFTVILPDNATAEDMAMYGLAGQMMSQLHDVNMAEMMYPGRNMLERGGGVLDVRMPDDFNRTQRLCQIFFGGLAGHDGELLDQSDLDRIPYLMQFQNSKGDAVIGDVNPDQMRADYRRQGIIDDSGDFNWDVFATMVEANRLGLWTGEENFSRSAA
ncbi:hypothetical protein EGN72_03090 [Pseudorhodobacter sp. E13]|nr:hypothetical protein EGN72_03090 [Pseudorhodobacter sp. E13]